MTAASRASAVEEAMAFARAVSREADVRQRLALRCPFCGSDPGEWCYSWKSRRRSHNLHASRCEPIKVAGNYGPVEVLGE